MRGDLLFLAQRIPYPPNKGDKIRSWHFLRHLARDWRVHLGCFVDDPADLVHRPVLEGICASTAIVELHPRRAKLRSLRGFGTGEALTLPYFRSAELARWADRTIAERRPQAVFVFSSSMAQYARRARIGAARLVIDMVDVDSQKWRQYAERKPWPVSAVFARESRRLLEFERQAAAESDATLFVSAAEAALFRRLAANAAGRVGHVENGVDHAFFAPENAGASPYESGAEPVVFTGAMDYWPNVDAVTWFADNVWAHLRAARPAARFAIVGANPAPSVRRLAERPGIVVTGRVEDIRPFIAHAAVVVAPLRVAQGVQNKVLEAMAMARCVVASPQALDGLAAEPDRHLLRAATGEEFAAHCRRVLETGDGGIGRAAREHVTLRHDWGRNLALLAELVAGPAPGKADVNGSRRESAAAHAAE